METQFEELYCASMLYTRACSIANTKKRKLMWTFTPEYFQELLAVHSAPQYIRPVPIETVFGIPFVEVRDQKQPWRLWTLQAGPDETT